MPDKTKQTKKTKKNKKKKSKKKKKEERKSLNIRQETNELFVTDDFWRHIQQRPHGCEGTQFLPNKTPRLTEIPQKNVVVVVHKDIP
jgi:hypothetical protein